MTACVIVFYKSCGGILSLCKCGKPCGILISCEKKKYYILWSSHFFWCPLACWYIFSHNHLPDRSWHFRRDKGTIFSSILLNLFLLLFSTEQSSSGFVISFFVSKPQRIPFAVKSSTLQVYWEIVKSGHCPKDLLIIVYHITMSLSNLDYR